MTESTDSQRAAMRPGRGFALLIAVVAGAGLFVLGTGAIGGSPAASPGRLALLDGAGLRAAIAAQRAGGLGPQDVIADVAIDPGRRTPPLDRECVPIGHCAVVGTLDGFGDPEGTVAVRSQEGIVPPATDATDLRPPVALRLSGAGPIEFLGHVALAPSGLAYGVADARAATSTALPGRVIAVDAWLVGIGIGFSCGPAPMPGPEVPAPFNCHIPEFLTAQPVQPVSGGGNSFEMSGPVGSVTVQMGAYREFAPRPTVDGFNDVPRRATYLLRMVVDDAVNCQKCRGWLVVGRLDAAPPAAPSASDGPTIRSAGELAALLASNRAAWLGRVVFIDGEVAPGRANGCAYDEFAPDP